MVQSGRISFDVSAKRRIILRVRAGKHFHTAELLESLGSGDSPGKFHTLKHRVHVTRFSQIIGVDRRRIQRVTGAQLETAAAGGANERGSKREGMAFDLLESVVNVVSRAEMELD